MSATPAHPDDVTPEDLEVTYLGRRSSLFSLAFRTLLLSLVTLGLYRFWMKTRLRRYYWGATRIGGEPLEYTGTGLEKIIGFLIAVTFLAVYLGIAQVALSFFGIAVIEGSAGAFNLAVLAVVPIYFYAIYRARAYVLARTRWRGIRFALKRGAWGYALRAVWHILLSLLSLGLLYPRQVFYLEKYFTDRTRFGDLELRQDGRWWMLFGPWFLIWITIAAAIAAFLLASEATSLDEWAQNLANDGFTAQTALYLILALPLILLILFTLFSMYRAVATRRMAMHKRAGNYVRLASSIQAGTVGRIWFFGIIGVLICSLIPLALVAAIVAAIFFLPPWVSGGVPAADVLFDPDRISEVQIIGGMILSALTYMIFMFSMSVFWHLFITQPLWRHYASTLSVILAEELSNVRQRDREEAEQAEGFADALDLGAAI